MTLIRQINIFSQRDQIESFCGNSHKSCDDSSLCGSSESDRQNSKLMREEVKVRLRFVLFYTYLFNLL